MALIIMFEMKLKIRCHKKGIQITENSLGASVWYLFYVIHSAWPFSLTISRYALSKGATALAVDIEEDAECEKSRRGKSAIQIFPHDVQHRHERLTKEELAGSFEVSCHSLTKPMNRYRFQMIF